ncbi:MAG: hypothetical protein K9W43_01835 [Candidatus Thorarchaeota archaeon]|nr:hypothetical protein [Candidatus Thorarchaeota archaeon]
MSLRTPFSPTSYALTRREAIINYTFALYDTYSDDWYSDLGYFHSYLRATPPDPRLGTYPGLGEFVPFFETLHTLNATTNFNWSGCIKLLNALVVRNKTNPYYGLVLDSTVDSSSVFACNDAIKIYPLLNISLDTNIIAQYVASLQGSSGGFIVDAFTISPKPEPNLLYTCFALDTLARLGRLDLIDTTAALDYVERCYKTDGGFAYAPATEYDSSYNYVPLGLLSLKALGRTDLFRINDTTNFLLASWDNATGCVPGGTPVDTERIIWSLTLLGTEDRIDIEKAITWILSCQSSMRGEFLPYPGANYDDERFEWARAAVHTLDLLNSLQRLDEMYSIELYAKYSVNQWYINYIKEHFGTTTTQGSPFVLPAINIDFVGIIRTMAPGIAVLSVIALPLIYLGWTDRQKKIQRRERLRKRRPK